MRDPILYGDYANTLDPTEPRLYESIRDFPTAQVWTSSGELTVRISASN